MRKSVKRFSARIPLQNHRDLGHQHHLARAIEDVAKAARLLESFQFEMLQVPSPSPGDCPGNARHWAHEARLPVDALIQSRSGRVSAEQRLFAPASKEPRYARIGAVWPEGE